MTVPVLLRSGVRLDRYDAHSGTLRVWMGRMGTLLLVATMAIAGLLVTMTMAGLLLVMRVVTVVAMGVTMSPLVVMVVSIAAMVMVARLFVSHRNTG